MKVIGKGTVTALEKKPRAKCRKWKIRVRTDRGEKSRRVSGCTYSHAYDVERPKFIAELSVPASDYTFSEWAEEWVALREKDPDISRATTNKNRTQIKVLNRGFGKMLMHEITPAIAQNTLLDIRESGSLSGTYMNQAFALMKSIMEAAVSEGLIQSNPLGRIKAPKKDTAKREALSRTNWAQFVNMLDMLPLDSHTAAVRLAVLAGMRRGEICALKWGDVEPGVIHVRRSLQEYGMKLKEPKTRSGIRDVPMVEDLEISLGAWKAIQAAQLSELGLMQDDGTFVCASIAGTIMHPENLDRWWRKSRGVFRLEGVRLHDLRHTYLTLLSSTGAPSSVLKSVAGWSSLAMADTYVHDDPDASASAVDSLSRTLKTARKAATDVPFDVPQDVPLAL